MRHTVFMSRGKLQTYSDEHYIDDIDMIHLFLGITINIENAKHTRMSMDDLEPYEI